MNIQKNYKLFFLLAGINFLCTEGFAGDLIKNATKIAEDHYPGSKIEIGKMESTRSFCDDENSFVSDKMELIEKNKIKVSGKCKGNFTTLYIDFSATKKILAAKKRIHPNEQLDASKVIIKEIDLTSPEFYDNKGLLLGLNTDVQSIESSQSIMENQPIYSYQVRKIPDIKKGDPVQVVIQSGNVELESQGFANESAHINGSIRVLINKTKKEVVGTLQIGNRVEVQL